MRFRSKLTGKPGKEKQQTPTSHNNQTHKQPPHPLTLTLDQIDDNSLLSILDDGPWSSEDDQFLTPRSSSSPDDPETPPPVPPLPLPLPKNNTVDTTPMSRLLKTHRRQYSGSDQSDMSLGTTGTAATTLKSDSSDSDTHSIRSFQSFRSSFRSFSHESLFALRKRDSSMLSTPLTPIISNGSSSNALENALTKFQGKQGTPKANILRIELLTLLRKESPIAQSPIEVVTILSKWWTAILAALHSRGASSHDKIAYMEAISKIMDRPEWKQHNTSLFSNLTLQTVRYCADRLSLKSVPVPVAAFSGKILAYGFFYCAGIAHQLLAHLQIPTADLERIGPICDSPVLKPPVDGKPQIPLGPWIRRWASSDSDTFYSFLKHYYCISGGTEPDGELPPGWIHLHAFILGSLDAVVRPRKTPAPPSLTPCIPKPRKIHKLKLLGALRELKRCCHPDYFAHVLAPAFEDILKSVALKTVVFDVEQCTALADVAEEILTVLECPLRSLDCSFWLNVVGIMLKSESHYTALRALAFLHNTFPPKQPQQSQLYADFIVAPERIKKYFCHWHPLIRAAYMRVVCYRVLPRCPQTVNLCLVTVYTKFITYLEYCQQNENPFPATDPCSRLQIVSREYEPTNMEMVVQNLQNLDFVDIGVMGDTVRPINMPSRNRRSASPCVTPRYFDESPPRVSAFDVEDDLFEGVEKQTIKKWGFIRKEIYTPDSDERSSSTSPKASANANGISCQYKFVMESSSSRSKSPPGSETFAATASEPSVMYPRLPFDLKEKNKDSQSTLDSSATATTSNTSVDDESFRVPVDPEEFKDLTEYVKYWKYAGRALNEWDSVVGEYETFVSQFDHSGVPHMVGDMGRCSPL